MINLIIRLWYCTWITFWGFKIFLFTYAPINFSNWFLLNLFILHYFLDYLWLLIFHHQGLFRGSIIVVHSASRHILIQQNRNRLISRSRTIIIVLRCLKRSVKRQVLKHRCVVCASAVFLAWIFVQNKLVKFTSPLPGRKKASEKPKTAG